MKIGRLRRFLARLQVIYDAGGATRQARAVASLNEALANSDEATVEDKIKEWAGASDSQDLVERYAQELESAGADETVFRTILAKVSDDRRIGKAEAVRIAQQYAKRRFQSRKSALEAIERRFLERLRAANETEFLGRRRVTPW